MDKCTRDSLITIYDRALARLAKEGITAEKSGQPHPSPIVAKAYTAWKAAREQGKKIQLTHVFDAVDCQLNASESDILKHMEMLAYCAKDFRKGHSTSAQRAQNELAKMYKDSQNWKAILSEKLPDFLGNLTSCPTMWAEKFTAYYWPFVQAAREFKSKHEYLVKLNMKFENQANTAAENNAICVEVIETLLHYSKHKRFVRAFERLENSLNSTPLTFAAFHSWAFCNAQEALGGNKEAGFSRGMYDCQIAVHEFAIATWQLNAELRRMAERLQGEFIDISDCIKRKCDAPSGRKTIADLQDTAKTQENSPRAKVLIP